MLFQDRSEAGKKLAKELERYWGNSEVLILGLARGGVVVASEIAKALQLPFDVVLVRKVGAPENPELALGAVGEAGVGIFNDHLLSLLGVSKEFLKKEVEKEKELIHQRKALYLKGRSAKSPREKTVILVDDGIATGASMKVAIEAVKAQGAAKIILAVPVAPPDSVEEMRALVDEVVCISSPASFQAVGAFYRNFAQVEDEEIIRLLAQQL